MSRPSACPDGALCVGDDGSRSTGGRCRSDTGRLQRNLKEIVAGRIDVVLLTSSQQVVHVLQLSREMGIEKELRRRFQGIAVGSIGPTTSEILREQGLPVDLEPKHPKMGHLVKEVSGIALFPQSP